MDATLTSDALGGLRAVRDTYPARTMRVAGAEWRLRDTGGPGPALVLLPGSVGTADIFYRQLQAFAPLFRGLAIDYPDADPADLADGLAGLLDHLGLRRACLLGSSLAGYWLQSFGARHPDRVAAMILANTFCEAGSLRLHPLFSVPLLRAATGEGVKAEWLGRLEARAPEPLRDLQLTLLRHGQSGASLRSRGGGRGAGAGPPPPPPPPPAPVMPNGRFPIGILDCADDPILTPDARDAVAARYPAARRVTLATGGHYPCVTQTAAYNDFVTGLMPES